MEAPEPETMNSSLGPRKETPLTVCLFLCPAPHSQHHAGAFRATLPVPDLDLLAGPAPAVSSRRALTWAALCRPRSRCCHRQPGIVRRSLAAVGRQLRRMLCGLDELAWCAQEA